MALTNPQYDAIMRMYNERQLRHQREQQEHIRIAYEKIPRLAEIDAEIASLSVRKAKAMLNGDASMDLDLNAAIRDRSQERAALLSMHGYPADYLELTARSAATPATSTARRNAPASKKLPSIFCTGSPTWRSF